METEPVPLVLVLVARTKNMVRFESEAGPQGGFLYLPKSEWYKMGEPKLILARVVSLEGT